MNREITNEIVIRMKKRRQSLGLSFQSLSEKTGINKSTLQRYESGFINNLPVEKLDILAQALDITPAYLMGWDKTPPIPSYNDIEIETPEDAMKFILKQPLLMAYGGYDTNKMTDDELVSFAKELLRQMELISYKFK
ncbi:helix-turn-helix domain-containing protein [Clostridium sp. DL1XJH146]